MVKESDITEFTTVVLKENGGGDVATPLVPWVNTATADTPGLVKVDGKTIFIWDDGTLSLNPQPDGGNGGSSEGGSVTFGDVTGTDYVMALWTILDKRYTKAAQIKSISLKMNDKCVETAQAKDIYLGIYEETEPDSGEYTLLGFSTNFLTPVANETSTWNFGGIWLKGDRAIKLYFSKDNYSELGTWPPDPTQSVEEFQAAYKAMMFVSHTAEEDDTTSTIFGQNTYNVYAWPYANVGTTSGLLHELPNLIPSGSIDFRGNDFLNMNEKVDGLAFAINIALTTDYFEPGKTLDSISIKMNSICNDSSIGYEWSDQYPLYPIENVKLGLAFMSEFYEGQGSHFVGQDPENPLYYTAESDNTQTPIANEISTWTFTDVTIPANTIQLMIGYEYTTGSILPCFNYTGYMSSASIGSEYFKTWIPMMPEIAYQFSNSFGSVGKIPRPGIWGYMHGITVTDPELKFWGWMGNAEHYNDQTWWSDLLNEDSCTGGFSNYNLSIINPAPYMPKIKITYK